MKHTIIALLLMTFAGIAQAQTSTPHIDQRQENQRHRIRQGVASGELTRRETAHAVHDQRHIHRMERRAKADGTVTCRERTRIHREQNRANRSLRHNKHDAQARPRAW
ncbi:hypothetical protein ACFQ21_14115 [Ohtaekwangia kribbensis]|jgi:hypothetical protein|uniref:Uncharacterized protein n=1 Tax=Ohtaekwangia kribbensis TaxID=688913 RepID=A0ABW3K4S0_9BACT